jgi:hypothetical protein
LACTVAHAHSKNVSKPTVDLNMKSSCFAARAHTEMRRAVCAHLLISAVHDHGERGKLVPIQLEDGISAMDQILGAGTAPIQRTHTFEAKRFLRRRL